MSFHQSETERATYGVLRVESSLILRCLTNQTLALRCPRHVRRSDAIALVVGDNSDLLVLPDAHHRVGCAKIDTDHRAH